MFDDTILPALRDGLNIEIIEDNNEKFIVLSDPQGFARQPVAIPIDLIPLIQMLNGSVSTKELYDSIKESTGTEPDISPLLNLSDYLDYMGFLDTLQFRQTKHEIEEYLNSPIRNAVCAGNSYPDSKSELKKMVEYIIDSQYSDKLKSNAKAIIVPHIDYRIGEQALDCYGIAYNTIRGNEPDLIVIFGTAHYCNDAIFMLSEKDFQTPLGIVKTDKELISEIKEHLSPSTMINELAHRFEHSIELQLVFLQRLYDHIEFKILPILVGSFSNFIYSDIEPQDDSNFQKFIKSLNEIIENQNKKTIYIASADLAHIGRKFGDDFDAQSQLEILKKEDSELIESLMSGSNKNFYNLIKTKKDFRKICGLPPIYSLFSVIIPREVLFLKYGLWNELETKSAVSFASLAIYD